MYVVGSRIVERSLQAVYGVYLIAPVDNLFTPGNRKGKACSSLLYLEPLDCLATASLMIIIRGVRKGNKGVMT